MTVLFAAAIVAIALTANLARPLQTDAATANTINFQARLESNTGAIVPDNYYDIEFKLHSTSSSSGGGQGACTGDCLWMEDYTYNSGSGGSDARVKVVNGYLTVYLGSLTAFPSTINWDQQLYLTMNIGGVTSSGPITWDGEMNPRLQLSAVPYAFRAATLGLQTGSNESTLGWATQTTANSLLLPNEGGTLCVQSSANCGFAPGTSASYIQNTTGVQSNANFYIRSAAAGSVAAKIEGANGQTADLLDLNSYNGTSSSVVAHFDASGNLYTNSLDAQSGALSIGTSAATSISLGTSSIATTVAASTLNLNAATIATNAASQTLFNTTVTTLNAFQAVTNATVGATTGTFNIRNNVLQVGGIVQTGSGIAAVYRSGDVTTASTNSGQFTLRSGNSSTSGNTGNVIIKSGDATSGTAGNVSVDTGATTAGTPTVQLGTANAKAVQLGNSSGTLAIASSGGLNVTTAGALTAGTYNGQTISSTANFTGTVAIQGANALTLGTASGNNGTIVFNSLGGSNTVTLQAPTTNPTSSYALKLPTTAPTLGQCLANDSSTIGQLTFTSCVTTNNAFIQGGNSFGGQAELGTNDNNALAFRTNNADKLILGTSGSLTFQQASTVSTSTGVLTLQSGNGSGTNIAGSNLVLNGGQGTGTGNGGSINLQVAKPGASGATPNSLTTVASISGVNGSVLFQNSADSTTAFQIQNATDNSNLFIADTANTKIGIAGAPTSSAYALTVNGGTYITGALALGSTSCSYKECITASSNALLINQTGSNSILNLQANGTNVATVASTGATTFQNSTNSTAAFQVQSAAGAGSTTVFDVDTTNNRVGIGTNSPQAQLQVEGNLNGTNQVWIHNGNSGSSASAQLLLTGDNGFGAAISENSSTNTSLGGANSLNIMNVNNGALALGTNNSPRVILSSTGDLTFQQASTVGTSAATNLTVQTGTTGSLTLDTGTTGSINIGTNANSKNLVFGSTTGGTTTLQSAGGVIISTLGGATGNNLCYNTTTYQVTTCTASISNAFVQNGNSFGGQANLGTNDNNALAFRTNAVSRLILDTSGNLTLQQASTIGTTGVSSGSTHDLTVQPGANSAATGTGAVLNLTGGDESGTTNATGGAVNITGGQATGASGTRNGGTVTINGGASAAGHPNDGNVNIGTANTAGITLGNSTNNTTLTLQGSGLTTLGGGLTVQGGDLTFSGSSARNIVGPTTGGLTVGVTAGPLTLSTTTSGTLSVTSAGALNLAGAAASSFSFGSNSLGITSSNFTVSSGGVLDVLGGSAGFQIGGSAASGSFLRGNGTSFVAGTIQSGDIPVCTGTCHYISNQTTAQSSANFNIQSAATSSVGGVIAGASGQTADLFDLQDANGINLAKFSAAGALTNYGVGNSLSGLIAPTANSTGTPGSNYYYAVAAVNGSITTLPGPSVALANNTSTITWGQVAGATGYDVYRSTSNNFAAGASVTLVSTITNGATTSFTDSGLTGSGVNLAAPSVVGLTVQASTGQGSDIFDVKGASGTVALGVNQSSNPYSNAGLQIYNGGLSVAGDTTGTIQALFNNNSNGNANASNIVLKANASQAAPMMILQDANGISEANFGATGNQLTLGTIAGSGTVYKGALLLADGTADNFGATLNTSTLTASRIISLPDASGTICLQSSAACGFETSTTTDFIRNQTSLQASSNFHISGSGTADTSLLTPLLDTASAVTLNIGNTATSINLNQNTAIAANKTLTANGKVLLQDATNSTSAVQIQNAAGTGTVLNVDTANQLLQVNSLSYSTGTIAQTGTAITGSGTTFTSGMVGGVITYNDGTSATISAFTDATHLTSSLSKTVAAGSSYSIRYGGLKVASDGSVLNESNTNSTTAFQIQNSSGFSLLNLDTVNSQVQLLGGNGFTNGQLTFDGSAAKVYEQYVPAFGIYLIGNTNTHASGGNGIQFRGDGFNFYDATGVTAYASIDDVNHSVTFKNMTSTDAFQVQNASSADIFNVDTSTTPNLITNGDFEGAGMNGWTAKGGSSLSLNTGLPWQGNNSLQVNTTTAANDGAQFAYTFTANTQYTLSLYGSGFGSLNGIINIGRQENGSDIDCLTNQTFASITWTRYSCTFTTGSTISGSNIYIKKTSSGAGSNVIFFIDGVQLQTGATVTAFNAGGAVQFGGTVNSPLTVQTKQDSTNSLQVQNAAGSNTVLDVDSLNGRVGIGTAAPAATLDVAGNAKITSSNATGGIQLYGGGSSANATLALGHNTSSELQLGVAGAANAFLTGTATSDGVLNATAGSLWLNSASGNINLSGGASSTVKSSLPLVVTNPISSGALQLYGGGSTNNVNLSLGHNTTGEFQLGVAGAANAFLTGTATSDGVLKASAGALWLSATGNINLQSGAKVTANAPVVVTSNNVSGAVQLYGGGSTNNVTLALGHNTSSEFQLGVAGAANAFLTGTSASDSIIKASAGALWVNASTNINLQSGGNITANAPIVATSSAAAGGIQLYGGSSTADATLTIGHNVSSEFTLGVAGNANDFLTNTAVSDVVLKANPGALWLSASGNINLQSGNNITANAPVVVTNGNSSGTLQVFGGGSTNNGLITVGHNNASELQIAAVGSANALFSGTASGDSVVNATGGALWLRSSVGGISLLPANSGAISIGNTAETGQITLGQSTATNTISIGSAAGSGSTQSILIGASSTTGSTTNVTIGSGSGGQTILASTLGTKLNVLGTADNDSFLCRNTAAGVIASCNTQSNGAPFIQGGNAFNAMAVLGTTDANGLQIVTGSGGPNARAYFDTSNNLYLGNAGSTGTAAAPNNFTIQGTGSGTAGTVGATLTIQGGAGAIIGTGSDGGGLVLQGGNGAGTSPHNGGTLTLDSGARVSTGVGVINLGTTNATAINIGNSSSVTTIQGTTSGILMQPSGGSSNLGVIVKPTSNTTEAFQVQNATGSNVLDVDTNSGFIGINTVPNAALEINSGTTNTSGLRFTQLTSTSTGGTQFTGILGLDTNGNVGLSQASVSLTSPALAYWDGSNNPTTGSQSYPIASVSGSGTGSTSGCSSGSWTPTFVSGSGEELTPACNTTSGSINWSFSQVPFEEIQFQRKAGGGTGADGTWFYSYANTTPTTEYGAGGFTQGYIIYFSEYHDCVGITWGSYTDGNQCSAGGSGHPLAAASLANIDDNAWHDIDIQIRLNVITVYQDGVQVLQYTDVYTRDLSDLNFGFGARTGGSNNQHFIKGLLVTKLGISASKYSIDNVSPLASSLYWDNVNGRLGVGNPAPSYALDVQDTVTGGYAARIQNLSTAATTSTSTSANGLLVQLGPASSSRKTGNYFIGFASGTGTPTIAGKIQGGSSAVAYTTTGADYAEYFKADPNDLPQPGELVSLDPANANSVVRSGAGSPVGIVSTSPGFIGNGPLCNVNDNNCDSDYQKYNVLISLSGQVPTKVSVANGAINVGDPIMASGTPGVGVKATSYANIVGYAEEATTTDGTIQVLVRPGVYNPVAANSLQGSSPVSVGSLEASGDGSFGGDLTITGNTTSTSLVVHTANVSGALTVDSLNATSITTTDLTVAGVSVTGNLTVAGSISAGSLAVTGLTTTQDLTVNGTASFGGDVRLTGKVNTRQATIKTFTASKAISAGSVVVLDNTPGNEGDVTTTTSAADTRVIGVAVTDAANPGDPVDVAIGGWVQVKVDTTPGANNQPPAPLTAGQLLETSVGEGTVQSISNPAIGSVLGKATSQQDSSNMIWVLITLQ